MPSPTAAQVAAAREIVSKVFTDEALADPIEAVPDRIVGMLADLIAEREAAVRAEERERLLPIICRRCQDSEPTFTGASWYHTVAIQEHDQSYLMQVPCEALFLRDEIARIAAFREAARG